jgi:nickel-type superoxide dismutase maturation protease
VVHGKLRGPANANWKDRVLLAVGKRRAFRVMGDSMRPTLAENDVVLIKTSAVVRVGDIILARHPYKKSLKILKRVSAIDGNGRCELLGDNPSESSDSRLFGTVPLKHVEGKVVCRLS